MPNPSDLDHIYGQDLNLAQTGDVNAVTSNTRTIQRLVRRLLTAPTTLISSDYAQQPTYGAGLRQRVGAVLNVAEIQAICLSQIRMEPAVAQTPAPTVSVIQINPTVAQIDIAYTDINGSRQSFNFNLEP